VRTKPPLVGYAIVLLKCESLQVVKLEDVESSTCES
jgi:hypothetical protein